jgi:hypothetical protein
MSSSWSTGFNPDQIALYFVISLATTALPAYLYHGVYSVDVHHYSLIYILVILISSTLLTVAYKQASDNALLSLSALRSSTSKKSSPSKPQPSITSVEAQAWSIFVVNAVYSGGFLALAFYVLRSFDVPYDYAISSVVASVVAWQVGAAVTK